ncbi:MAG: hypothetical protein ACI30Y_02730 [Candidatus Limisoma sp.]
MNKLKQIFFIGLAFLMPTMVFAQSGAPTLTQDWKNTSGLPVQGTASYGVGYNGTVYVNYTTGELQAFSNGTSSTVTTGLGGGKGITRDSKGNLLILDKSIGSTSSMNSVKLYNATTKELSSSINITLPEGITSSRMDITGRAVGDFFSETGAAVFFCGNGQTSVSKIFFANGAQVVEKTKAIPTSITFDGTTIAVPLTDDPESDEIAIRVRGDVDFKYYNGTAWTAYKRIGSICSNSGGDIFTLNGTLYTIEPAKINATKAYYDGFQIVDRSTNTVVATHAEEITSAQNTGCYGTSLTIEKISDYKVRIYQYHSTATSGTAMVAQYTFGWETEDLPKKNAFAYDITVEETAVDGEDNKYIYDVSYRLSAPAESATVEVWMNGETKIKEYEGTTNARLVDGVVDNLNTVSIPSEELRGGKSDNLVFKVSVKSTPVNEPTLYSKSYKFFSPYGLAVNNCEDSESFGRIFATETSTNAISKTTYMSSSANGGIGTGVYAFNPLFDPITNETGGYGFKCGMATSASGAKYSDVSESILDVKRLAMSEDGRLFVGRQNPNYTGLWEINPDDLSGSMIFEETDKTHNIIAMSVQGSGEDLKIALLENAVSGFSATAANNKLNIYNLGGAWSWAEGAPSKAIATKVVCPTHTNICFNPDGTAVMVGQYKAGFTASDTTPSYENYLLSSGTANWADIITQSWGGAMAWNVDGTLFAMANGRYTVGVYSVDVDAEGVPTFTEKWSFTTTCGSYTTALAFDVANNLYVASNSSEVIKCWVLPNKEAVTVSASSQYTTSGVEDVLQPVVAKAYGARGEIHIQGEFNSLSVYTMSGQAVVTETCDDVIPVAKGYYIVVVDGNAQKVAVR